ncbi:SCO0607 family lipoprotein [Streptomyces sp. NPDC004726]
MHRTRRRSSLAAGTVAAAVTVLLTTGCSAMEENQCRGGEYPVIGVGPEGGGACVPNGEEPGDGYVRYPEGKVPKKVDDKWDVYWRDHYVDENGKEVKR